MPANSRWDLIRRLRVKEQILYPRVNNNNNNNNNNNITWNMKCIMKPIIIGATGIVTEGLKKNFEAIAGKHSVDPLHKTAMLGTLHIMRKVLQSET